MLAAGGAAVATYPSWAGDYVEDDTVMAEAAHRLVQGDLTGRVAYSQQLLAEFDLGPDPLPDMLVAEHPRSEPRRN